MELDSLPQAAGLSVEVRVPRGELVGFGVSIEFHYGSVSSPFEFFIFDLIRVSSGPSLLLNSSWEGVLEVNWRLSLSVARPLTFLGPVSSILLVVPLGSRGNS